jgi:hypothetical protein
VPHVERQHARRHAAHAGLGARRAAEVVDQVQAGALAVDQQRRIGTTGTPVGREQRAHALALLVEPRRGVADRAARAHGRAGAAADAQVRLDDDAGQRPAAGPAFHRRIAADRLRRTHVDADGAADLLVAAVGADLLLVAEELRLLELARALAQLQHRVDQRRVVGRVEVALWGLVQGDDRRGVQVEHEVEVFADLLCSAGEVDRARRFADPHTFAVAAALGQVDLVVEIDRVVGAGVDAGVAARAQVQVDRVALGPAHFEGAEPAADVGDRARVHRHRSLLRQRAATLQQHAHVEFVGQHLRGSRRALGAADHQHPASRLVAHRRHRVAVGQLRERNQGRDLRRGGLGIFRPAAGFADVDEADRPLLQPGRAFGLRVQFEEEAALLRAGHEQLVAALGRALERAGFAPAQRGVNSGEAGAGVRPERLDQARAVQRHRLVAVADQGRHREVVSVR